MFTFLHVADIHMDSPLRNLSFHEDAPVEMIRGATRRAMKNLIALAIKEDVAFVLIAGDLYDGSWRDYNTGLFFIEQMTILRRVGIAVFLVSGNHDAASRITKSLRLPDNVVHFSSSRPHTERINDLRVAIHGQSYARPALTANLALAYPEPVSGFFNIGLLHTSLSGRPGHAPYAPCTQNDLLDKGYAYWALGHVHQKEVVNRDPWIVFPGNLQGRHIRETGPRGATLVRVEHDRVSAVTPVDLDVVRWEVARVECSAIESLDDFWAAVKEVFSRLAGQADGRPLILRVQLDGESPIHAELVAESRYLQGNLQALARDAGDIWIEKVVVSTCATKVLDPAVLDGSPLAGLFSADNNEDPELYSSPDLQTLATRLPVELREHDLIPTDEDGQRQLLVEVRDMVLSRIIKRVQQ